MAKIHMPAISELGEKLTPLVGQPTRISESARPNSFDDACCTARYITRDDRLAALIRADLRLAAHLGAALAMMTADDAEHAITDGTLDEDLTDAYSEIANILASLLCADDAPHVRWTELETDVAGLSEGDKTLIEDPCERIDVEVEIEAFGCGRLSILSARLD